MANITRLDYETFSEADLKKVGQWAYAKHPSTRILCVSWQTLGQDDEPRLWVPGQKFPERLNRAFKEDELWAFGANFERCITNEVSSKLGFHIPEHDQWNDTMALCRMCALPGGLEGAAMALGVKQQKDKDGKRLLEMFSKPQARSRQIILPKDRPEDFKRLTEYCRQDVRAEGSVHEALPIKNLSPFEKKVWMVDGVINHRGVKIDRRMATGAMKLVARAKLDGGKLLSKVSGGKITSAGQRARIMKYAVDVKFPLVNMKKETVAIAMADETMPKSLRRILEIYDDTNITSVAKFAAMLRTADPGDDRVRDAHAYHAATTGRWGGRIVQTQNIARPLAELSDWDREKIRLGDGDALELIHGEGSLLGVLRDAIRNAIIAREGCEFFIVDKASIEARVLGWLAGCKGYQKAYKEGLDLYCLCAAGIFNRSYKEIFEGYKRGEKEATDMRKVGKDSVLAQGYGQGEDGFFAFCQKKGSKITIEMAKVVTKAFRVKNFPEIPKLWKDVEKCAIRAIKTGKPQYCGVNDCIRMEMIQGYLAVRLPSGRRLWYPQAHIKTVVNKWGNYHEEIRFYTAKGKWWGRNSTYGGKLVENIVQAIARDLLARALVRCEEKKLFPVMHIHDEIVAEILKKLERSIDEMHTIFRDVPRWAPGLLLGSGGFVSPFYKK